MRLPHFSWRYLLLPLLSSAATCAFGQSQPTWNLIWSDEFNGAAGSAPNSQYWSFDQGLPPDGGQNYNCVFGQTTDGCDPNNPNVYLDGNGHLVIVARQASGAPNGITSGRIKTTGNSANSQILYSTQYGRVEATMMLPVDSGNQGVWPAFWMLGTDMSQINWPASGEIDILEYIGKSNLTQIYSTLHGPGYANTGLGVRDTNSAGWSGWHTFGAIWSPNQVQFYVDSPTNIFGTISTADIMANQAWVNGGQAQWPFNLPFFLILNLNMGGPFPGNVDSTTTYPQQLLVDDVRVYQAAAPAAPTAVSATGLSPSQARVSWTASSSPGVTYNIYRSTVSGTAPMSQAQPNPAVLPQTNQTLIANNLTATSFTDSNLAPGQTYYYIVTSSGEYSGESAAAQASVTLPSDTAPITGTINVSAGGYSGTGTYIPNSFVTGGFTNAFTATVDTSAVTNPAPQDVYHTERWGPQTWNIGHLQPGGSYSLRMHFAESAFSSAGSRMFNVLVNGETVLSNFDIYQAAGAQNKVITQTIDAVADTNGFIALQLQPGSADQPEIRALDISSTAQGTDYGVAAGTTTDVAINSGGTQTGNWEDDEDGGNFGLPDNPLTSGGGTNTTTQTISTAGVTNPAPAAVYQTERYGQFGEVFTGLPANTPFTIRLHFAEGVTNYSSKGDRLFNVVVNGNQVLTNFDIEANAGGVDKAYIATLNGQSDEHGLLSVQLSEGAVDLPSLRGIEIIAGSTAQTATVQIDAGGPASGAWVADTDFSGGMTSSTSASIDTSQVSNPAPMAVYQTDRFGASTYTIPNLTPGKTYTVNLHFAEIYWNAAGKRLFNVSINQTAVLTNFDIFAAAGGENKAIVKSFTATASSAGQIVIQFTNGSADLPKVSGIAVF